MHMGTAQEYTCLYVHNAWVHKYINTWMHTCVHIHKHMCWCWNQFLLSRLTWYSARFVIVKFESVKNQRGGLVNHSAYQFSIQLTRAAVTRSLAISRFTLHACNPCDVHMVIWQSVAVWCAISADSMLTNRHTWHMWLCRINLFLHQHCSKSLDTATLHVLSLFRRTRLPFA